MILDRADRFCQACMSLRNRKMMEDEYHLVFECVRYDSLRSSRKWGSLYMHETSMKAFMNQEDQGKVAHFIHMLLEIRKDTRILNQDVDLFESSSTGSEIENPLPS